MFNYTSNSKRTYLIAFVFILILFLYSPKTICCVRAENENIEEELNENVDLILDDIDFSELDESVYVVPNLNFSFKDFVKTVLSGDFNFDYNSTFSFVKSQLFDKIKDNLRFFIYLFIIVILFEIFKSFNNDKCNDIKASLKIVFLFLLSTLILIFVKSFYEQIKLLVEELFNFAGLLFPILVGLLTLSGSVKSASVFSSFSVFLLETGSFIIKFVLLPLAVSILLLSLFGSIFSKGNFNKLTSLFKQIFRYIIVVFFAVFGLLSTVNIISSSSHDGLNLKLTKYAIKNYVPILGGYVSEGFDFLYSCAVLIKNAIGICSIVIIVFKILSPLLVVLVVSLLFKVLAVVTGFIGDGAFSNMFEDVSKSFSNFLSVILGSFLIVFVFVFLIILSVGVV